MKVNFSLQTLPFDNNASILAFIHLFCCDKPHVSIAGKILMKTKNIYKDSSEGSNSIPHKFEKEAKSILTTRRQRLRAQIGIETNENFNETNASRKRVRHLENDHWIKDNNGCSTQFHERNEAMESSIIPGSQKSSKNIEIERQRNKFDIDLRIRAGMRHKVGTLLSFLLISLILSLPQ